MTPVLETSALTKRYGRRPAALADCDLSVPAGRVIGLVGSNGAGKSTLLHLACGLTTPTEGTIRVLGGTPGAGPDHLAKVGFVAQDTPLYAELSVADHLKLGARLNPRWDAPLAARRLARLDLDPRQRAGRLSGGQRAQLALALAAAKRPELLIFDEPAAALDPLARHAFLEHLMESVRELGAAAVLSSHALADVAWVCDYVIVLAASRVRLAGDVAELLATHARITGDPGALPAGAEPVSRGDRGAVVRLPRPLPVGGPAPGPWQAHPLDLEELVLAYLDQPAPLSPEAHR